MKESEPISNYSLRILSPIPRDFPEILLILVNLLPIVGIWFWGWKLSDLFILYWAESLIIGFYWFAKLITAYFLSENRQSKFPIFMFSLIFFSIHFGGFMFGHLIAVTSLVIFHGTSTDLSVAFLAVRDALNTLTMPLVFLFISHGFSFVRNYILNKEYKYLIKRNSLESMPPYGRIIVMHISIFLMAALLNASRLLAPFSAILIVIAKILTDLRGHRIEHRKMGVNNV
jgi:hypothetical protein